MAKGAAKSAVIGKAYRVGGDDWWRARDIGFILTTDKLIVTDRDDVYVYFDIYRDGTHVSDQRVNLCFFDEDFEPVQHAVAPLTDQSGEVRELSSSDLKQALPATSLPGSLLSKLDITPPEDPGSTE